MMQSLKDLNRQIYSYDKNSHLNYFYGENLKVLSEIHQKVKINSIAFNLDYTPYAKKRDKEII